MKKLSVLFLLVIIRMHLLAQEESYINTFKLHVINVTSIFSSCVVFDVDHDNDFDIVSGAFWYEAPHWKKHFVADVEVINGRPDGYSHLPMDVNRDGWIDIVHCNFRSKSLYWLEHPGPQLGEWKKHVIEEPGPMETGRLYDIDGDGEMDVLPNGWNFNAWYTLAGAQEGKDPHFNKFLIGEEGAGHGNGFGDLNADGRGDYVGIKGWYEAPKDPRTQSWTWHPDFDLGRTSIPIIVADIDLDSDADLIYAQGHDYGIYWEEQSKNDAGAMIWHKHLIDSSWSQGHSPLWVDLDNNGIMEFVNGKRFWSHEGKDPGARDPLVIYSYEYDVNAKSFKRRLIQENGPAGFGLDPKAIDLDQDGDLDLVLPGRSGLYWYENLLN
ncbi:MAG: VCBS repeat-containing protein [Saprospiraceae bacterium]|nr:VCBS repeat-containing protein [Saprospiraceae bacterium]